MHELHDFLLADVYTADRCLLACRTRMQDALRRSGLINEQSIVALVALDGAVAHKRHHPGLSHHYAEFVGTCRQIMQAQGGVVFPENVTTEVDYVACGWFANDARDALIAMAGIQNYYLRVTAAYRQPWVHERHPLAGIGQSEYSAFRMLKLARRDQTIVDPEVWQKLPEDVRRFAETTQIRAPDIEKLQEDIEQVVADNVAQVFDALAARSGFLVGAT
jgi:hypothetical protein